DSDQILCSEIVTDEVLNTLEPEKNLFKFKPTSIGTVDYRNLDLLERNTFTYVCGYIMKKCLEKHVCQDCINYVCHQKQLDQSHLLVFLKAYFTSDHSTFGNLMVPHNDFYNFTYELENIFIKLFPSISIENGVGSKLRLHFSNVPFSHPCKHLML
ncbi:THAP-type domain-containing protein, partial [Aphis craccivora]